jgi:iron-sulfur cluster assembly protein
MLADPTHDPNVSPAPAPIGAPLAADAVPAVGPALRVTVRAAKVMRGQLDKRGTPQAAIRFGIRGGGCTGYSYMFQFEDGPPRTKDTVVEAAHGVKIYVDPKSLLLVRNTEIDFETGIRGHGFRFANPNIDSSCGCGESISF